MTVVLAYALLYLVSVVGVAWWARSRCRAYYTGRLDAQLRAWEDVLAERDDLLERMGIAEVALRAVRVQASGGAARSASEALEKLARES